ncbi:MAG: hypothetical protein KKD18_00100 [Nanoarchaeota archaeon]|nr:hypothetical protein [Nanoarchaeota archaeon]
MNPLVWGAGLGFSNSQLKRLKRDNAIKIADTRITSDREHYEWYYRPIGETELLEDGDVIKFGKKTIISITAQKRSPFIYLWWQFCDFIDWVKDLGK